MKGLFIAALLALAASAAHAETKTLDTTCKDPEFELLRQLNDKSCEQIATEKALQDAETEGQDLVNAAQAQIISGSKANVLAGMGALQRYLQRAEEAFASAKSTYPDIQACASQYSNVRWNALPCDPNPYAAKVLNNEFKRRGWPTVQTASEGYGWLLQQYPNATEAEQRDYRQFATGNAVEILTANMLPKVRQLAVYDKSAKSEVEKRIAFREQQAKERSLVGNITTMGDRLHRVVSALLGNAALLLVLGLVAMRFVPKDKRRAAWIGGGYIMLTSALFGLLYVPFGGWFEALTSWIPGIWKKVLVLVVFIPAVVAVRRYLPRLLPFLAPKGKAQAANGLHGSAHWSTTADAIAKGRYQKAGHVLADSHGFALGRPAADDAAGMAGMDARFRYMGHMLTCAPTGSGKGIGAVIPNLLDYPGSCVVLDIKGENYAVTSRYRRDVLGHDVYLLDPFGVTGGDACGINWLDRLDPDSPDVVGESAALADMLVMTEGHGSDSSAHFNETAKTFLRGVLVHVATLPEERRHMGEVRRLLTGNMDEFAELLLAMEENKRGGGIPVRAVNSLLATPEKERGSILSTVRRHLDFLDDTRIVASLARSDLNLADLKRKPMTVYLVMPPSRLEANKRYIRAFVGQCLAAITASNEKPAFKVAFLLDEFAQLGRMQAVEDAISLVRGYGAAFWLFVQDLSQLKAIYPKWQTFLANTGKQFFGTADYDTAKFISDSLGKFTVEYRTQGSSSSMGTANLHGSTGSSDNQQFTGRDLLTPDEVMRLPPDRPVVMMTGEAPYVLQRLNYLTDPEYAGLFDPNPYH
ncbi:type IV secretory system conjugative DNA transfer family protein [Salmonella enterica]|nr:type IV secretory system conjugative DNA transfer family protein [Salmonella enterica]